LRSGACCQWKSRADTFAGQALERLAKEQKVAPVQLAIAWVLARGENIVPLIGSRTREQLADSLGALKVKLSSDELAQIEEAVPADGVAGTRYGAEQMRHLDSER
jgi:aryl-alcohol dehydrogenase-like predicted oxidoreductase